LIRLVRRSRRNSDSKANIRTREYDKPRRATDKPESIRSAPEVGGELGLEALDRGLLLLEDFLELALGHLFVHPGGAIPGGACDRGAGHVASRCANAR
jgi:hypothetical protein